MAYPGVEVLLIGWLSDTLSVRTVTDLPAKLAAALPVNQVLRIGGPTSDDSARFDQPTVTVDSYGADRTAAEVLALDTHEAVRERLPGTSLYYDGGYAVVTRALTITGPSWRPYDNTDLRRFGATYRLFIKNHPAS